MGHPQGASREQEAPPVSSGARLVRVMRLRQGEKPVAWLAGVGRHRVYWVWREEPDAAEE